MKRVVVRGAARMKELGHRQVQVWFEPTEFALLQEVAERSGRTLADVVRGSVWFCAPKYLSGRMEMTWNNEFQEARKVVDSSAASGDASV